MDIGEKNNLRVTNIEKRGRKRTEVKKGSEKNGRKLKLGNGYRSNGKGEGGGKRSGNKERNNLGIRNMEKREEKEEKESRGGVEVQKGSS